MGCTSLVHPVVSTPPATQREPQRKLMEARPSAPCPALTKCPAPFFENQYSEDWYYEQ